MAYINTGTARATELVFEYWLNDSLVKENSYSILSPEFGRNLTQNYIQTMSEEYYLALMTEFVQWCKQREGQPELSINPQDAIITDVILCPIGR